MSELTDHYLAVAQPRKPSILIADDSISYAKNIAELLALHDFHVDLAHTFTESLELLRPDLHAVALIDLALPGNGFELASEIVARSPDTIPVILTGYATLESAIQATQNGIFGFVLKDTHSGELILTVKKAFEQWLLTRSNRDLHNKLEYQLDRLRSSESRYRNVIESSPYMIFSVGRDGNLLHMNQTARNRLELHDTPNSPNLFSDLIAPSFRPSVLKHIRQACGEANADHLTLSECSFLTHTGKSFDAEIRLAAIANCELFPDEDTICHAFVRDLDETSRLRDQMLTYQQKAEDRKRLAAIGTMVAGIAHEIRTPLQVISAGLDSEPPINSKVNSFHRERDRARQGVAQIGQLVDDLLQYSSEIRIDPSRVSPLSLVLSALADLESESHSKKIVTDIGPLESCPTILVDPIRMRQVLINLLHNALESTPDDGQVQISGFIESGHTDNPTCVFQIEDEGRGIPQDIQEKIFVPFFTTKPRGTGLGLPIVQRILEAHSAQLFFSNRPDNGTRVQIRLPFLKTDTPFQKQRVPR
ncbi:MAG: ATP-binding protein [Planctomycetota bacterium]|jgi:hypothetical protein|nr:ATP-binding protein [Planctomycetota bacterium]